MTNRVGEAIRGLSARLGPHGALILMLVCGLALAVGLTAAAAEVYENVADGDGVAGLDQPLLEFAQSLRTPELNTAITSYTNVAGSLGMPLIAISAIVMLSFAQQSWTPALLIVVASAGSLLMTVVAKGLIGRERPPLADAVPPYEHSGSFPSGHTLNAVVIAGVIAYLLILQQETTRAKVITGSVAGVFAFTIGLSRVYLGHHWFTDVLGAWMLGAAWLALVLTAHQVYLWLRRRQRPDAATEGGPAASADPIG